MREFRHRNGVECSSASSRPISLDLHTYRHQEHYLGGGSSNNFYNKENFHHQHQPYAQKHHSVRPTSYYPHQHSHLRSRTDRRHGSPAGQISKPIDLDAFSTSSISDDDDLDEEEENDGRFDSGALVGARHTFYSTSDLTSDSEICGRLGRYPVPIPKREIGLRTKFPSLSTIYPDNSSLSFDDYYYDSRKYNTAAIEPLSTIPPGRKNNRNDENFSSSLSNTPPKTARSLEMIEEISPVLPPPDINDDLDLPPVIQPLKLNKEWKPIQTSTMTNFHRQFPPRFPKTNPHHPGHYTHHHGVSSTPRQLANKANNNNNNPPRRQQQQTISVQMESPTPPPRSLFDPHYQDLATTCSNASVRPEQFNLPAQLAKQCDIKGILYLNITIVGSTLIVTVKNAAFFLNSRAPVSSCVKVEIKRTKSSTYRKRTKYESRFRSYRSCVAHETNQPDFYEEFKFRISQVHLKLSDKLGITVYATSKQDTAEGDFTPREVLGRMSFPLRKLFRKANLYDFDPYGGEEIATHDPVKVCDGGYFLLPEKTGSERYFSQDSILHRKYYDEIGGSTTMSTTTSSLHSGSPLKEPIALKFQTNASS